jgi:hypothetical protein
MTSITEYITGIGIHFSRIMAQRRPAANLEQLRWTDLMVTKTNSYTNI